MDDDEFETRFRSPPSRPSLKPKVVETFDKIASRVQETRRLQEQDIANQLQSESLSPSQERKYKKLKDEIIVEVIAAPQSSAHRLAGRAALRHQQEAGLLRGPLLRLGDSHGVAREDFLKNYPARSSIRAG